MAGSTGTVTATEQTVGLIKKIKLAFITGSSSQGNEATGATSHYYNGVPIMCITDPSTSAVPEANWDITITDGDGIDILRGYGANRTTDALSYLEATTNFRICSGTKLTLNVTNAGTEKEGDVYLYLYPCDVD